MPVRVPSWLRTEVETLGKQVLNGDIEGPEADDLIADLIFERDDSLVHDVVEDYARKKRREWIKAQMRTFYTEDIQEEETGYRQPELFPYLPRLLEISPGRFAHINAMTGADWDSALRQAEVKADNASGFAKAVKRAYDAVRPLLNEGLTTVDVAERLG